MEIKEPDFSYSGYTYADYLRWTVEQRFELLRGRVFKMSPAPGTLHQRIKGRLFILLSNFLGGHQCEVFLSPFDVRLPKSDNSQDREDDHITSVVQPDLCVVCDPSKIDARGCLGAPDIVVEILSPGNSPKELSVKFDIYEAAGVREYWIIQPEAKSFVKYVRNESGMFIEKGTTVNGGEIRSEVLPGFSMNLNELFQER